VPAARSRSERLLRGFAVAVVVCGPVLAFAAPAIGDDTTSVADPPPDTTTTVPQPSPLENPPPATTTPSTDATTDVTDPTLPPVTDPTLPPVTDATLPPVTDTTQPATTDTTDTTTATSTPPSTDGSATPVVPGSGSDPTSGTGTKGTAGGTTTDTVASPQTKPTSHDGSLPMKELVQQVWGAPSAAPITKPGALAAKPAVYLKPVADAAKTIGEGARALSAQLHAPWNQQNVSGSWGDLGSAAPRFGPWIILLAMAWLVRTVIASILADRTAGPRRRRWTLL
jgi:hypothetical protein